MFPKKEPKPEKPDIRYAHPSHEEFNRRLEQEQNPQPKSSIDQKWLPPARNSPLPNLRDQFERNRDPYIAMQLDDLNKTEAQRREEQTGRGSNMINKDQPAPALKPSPEWREPVERAQFNRDWLKEQRDAVMRQAAKDQPSSGPDRGPRPIYIIKGPSY